MKIIVICAGLGLAALTGCGGRAHEDPETMATYKITVHNATANQPLSPLAVGLQHPGNAAWQVGAPASLGLEQLAEGGATMPFLQELMADVTAVGDGPVLPGATATLLLNAKTKQPLALTLASMLGNTNDAFTGVTDLRLDHLAVAQTHTQHLPVYDAGTEPNSEGMATIPGPAAGGEGFNGARDDAGFVTMHPGVVSADDGLQNSALDESHRFASGSIILNIVRTR